ncbi:MAG: hypothetical protein IPL55_23380 [Saprospiraceae bacterium]|nr:hypothetical protein [Saprospiraceae bacterium]
MVGVCFQGTNVVTFFRREHQIQGCSKNSHDGELASALSPTAVGGAPVKAALLLNKGFNPGNVGFMLTWGIIEDLFFYIFGVIMAIFFSQQLVYQIGLGLTQFFTNNAFTILLIILFFILYYYLLRYNLIPGAFRLCITCLTG